MSRFTFDKLLQWTDRDEAEWQQLFRAVIGERLLDLRRNESGGITLIFANASIAILQPSLSIHYRKAPPKVVLPLETKDPEKLAAKIQKEIERGSKAKEK